MIGSLTVIAAVYFGILDVLQQAPDSVISQVENTPWWVILLLLPAGAWFTQNAWPWLREQLDEEFKERRTSAAHRFTEREDRFLAAVETSAQASERAAQASTDVAAALQTLAQVRVADNLTLQRVERRLDELWDERPSRQTQKLRPNTTGNDI